MSSPVAVMVDGAYLDYVLRDLGVFGKLDYSAFVSALADGNELLRAYYYHCLPYQSAEPTEEEAQRFRRMQRFLDNLDRLPRFMVRQGRLARRTRGGKVQFEQKQVDILMATDIVLLSAKRQIRELVLVTGDSDFLPAVRVARDEGVIVRLVHGLGRNKPRTNSGIRPTNAWPLRHCG